MSRVLFIQHLMHKWTPLLILGVFVLVLLWACAAFGYDGVIPPAPYGGSQPDYWAGTPIMSVTQARFYQDDTRVVQPPVIEEDATLPVAPVPVTDRDIRSFLSRQPISRTRPTLSMGSYVPTSGSRTSERLAAAPPIFGDFLYLPPRLSGYPNDLNDTPSQPGDGPRGGILGTNIATRAAGTEFMKIAENNIAMPRDRIYFSYQHYNTGFPILIFPHGDAPPFLRPLKLDRYTLGIEKIFGGDRNSIELRLPFFATNLGGGEPAAVIAEGNGVGNLGLIYKRLLYRNDSWAFAAGLGLTVPTANDLTGVYDWEVPMRVANEAVHLTPFIGATHANGRWFSTSFFHVDIAANGNTVTYAPENPHWYDLTREKFYDQNLIAGSISLGYWLYQTNNSNVIIRGLAPVAEIHYTGMLNENDSLGEGITHVEAGPESFMPGSQYDFLNLTAGFHLLLGDNCSLRIAGAFPLQDAPHRSFDGEFLTHLEWRR
jgi:hypothetical protein